MAVAKQTGLYPVTTLLFSWATDLVCEWGDDAIHCSVKEVPEYYYSTIVFWYNGEVAYEYTDRWWDTTYLLEAGKEQELEMMFKQNIFAGLERFFRTKSEQWQSNADKARTHKERYES